MLGITVADAVLILGIPGAFLTLYFGWKAGGRAKRDDIDRAPAIAAPPSLLIGANIGERIAAALEHMGASMEQHLEALDRRDEEQRREGDRKVMQQILEELRRKP